MNTKHILYFAIAAGVAYYVTQGAAPITQAFSWPVTGTLYNIGYNFGAGNGFSTAAN